MRLCRPQVQTLECFTPSIWKIPLTSRGGVTSKLRVFVPENILCSAENAIARRIDAYPPNNQVAVCDRPRRRF